MSVHCYDYYGDELLSYEVYDPFVRVSLIIWLLHQQKEDHQGFDVQEFLSKKERSLPVFQKYL